MLYRLAAGWEQAADHAENDAIIYCNNFNLPSAFQAKHGGLRNLNMHDRLTDIEVKIAHMEQSLSELSDVLYSQQQLLDRLAKGLDRLAETAALAADSPGNSDAAPEKPPHY